METPVKRGRPRDSVETTHVMVRMPMDLLQAIDNFAASLAKQMPLDISVSRAAAIRELCKRGLASLATTPPQEPVEPPQRPGAAKRTDAPQIVPAHIQRIAEFAAQYDKLSLAELAQELYLRDIYRARDATTGEAKPINRGTLKRMLERAREAGLL